MRRNRKKRIGEWEESKKRIGNRYKKKLLKEIKMFIKYFRIKSF